MFHPTLLILTAAVFLPAIVRAAALVITNPSFETPNTANGTFSGNSATGPSGWGWSVYNTGPTNSNRFFGVWDVTGTTSFVAIPHGQQVGVVFLDDALSLEAGLRQTLGDTLQLTTEYTLSVGVGNFAPPGPWNFTGFPGYRVELLAGSTVLAMDNNTLSPGEGIFQTSTVTFTTGASHPNSGQALAIRLVSLNGPGVEVNFDNVTLNAVTVPEPTSLALLSLGGLIALMFRRRQTVSTAGKQPPFPRPPV